MSRRPPPALPPQPEDPVPVEHDSDDGDGGASMVDAWLASLHFSSSPPQLLPPCSAWATMVVVRTPTPSPPWSPRESIHLWNLDDEQRPPQQMGPAANRSAEVLGTDHDYAVKVLIKGLKKMKFRHVIMDLQLALSKIQEDVMSRLEIDMNIKTGGSSLAIIESYDDDNELGDNDAEQSEILRKRPRNRSLVWLHFTKVLSKDSGMVTAMCKHCDNALKGGSTLGTSHLLRHLKNVHQMDLPSLSQAWKEPQRSSCSQKLENTGSAACAGIPTPLTENNENELQDKDFKLGDTSRKRLKGASRTKSDVWLHFTKLPSADPGGVMAECNYCKKTLKADSQNGTSSLRRHLKKVHQMDLSSLSETWKEPQRSCCS